MLKPACRLGGRYVRAGPRLPALGRVTPRRQLRARGLSARGRARAAASALPASDFRRSDRMSALPESDLRRHHDDRLAASHCVGLLPAAAAVVAAADLDGNR